jgi:hypothetical protein
MGLTEERVLVVDPKARAADRLLKRLAVAVKTFGLYPARHPVAERALQDLLTVLRPYLETYGAFVTRVSRQGFVVDGVPFEGEAHAGLAFHLYTRKVALLSILPAATERELASLLAIAGMDRVSLEAAGGPEHLLWQSGVGNAQIIELTLEQEQEVEALGLNAFLALIGRSRLAPRERQAVVDILSAADQTARLLDNIYLMAPQVFEGIGEQERIEHAFQAVRSLDRIILDEPLETQSPLYAHLAEALLLVEAPLRSALPHLLLSRAADDTSAKYLLTRLSAEQVAELIVRGVRGPAAAEELLRLLTVLALPAQKAEAVVALLEARLQPAGEGPTWLRDALRSSLPPQPAERPPEVPAEFVFDDTLIFINHEELAQRLQEAKAIDEGAATREVILTLVDVLREEHNEEELTEAAAALTGYLSWMVEHREFPLLATVLRHVKRLASTAEGLRARLAADVARGMTEHPLLDHLLAALWSGRETPVEQQVRSCLEAVAEEAVTPLVRVLGGEPRAGMRAILCDLLAGIGRDHVRELAAFVDDERWYLVRNIANILGRLQTPEVVGHLGRLVDHPEYRVRREVADALARVGTEEAQRLLVRLLDDPDPRIRLRALQALNAWGTRLALPRLLDLVAAPDPLNRLFAHKAAAVEALERLGAPEALPVLRRLARLPLALGAPRRRLRDLARRAVLAIEGQRPQERQGGADNRRSEAAGGAGSLAQPS